MPNSKPRPGANVDKYMRRTEELRLASEHVSNVKKAESLTRWAEGGGKQQAQANLNRSSKKAAEELRQLNYELKTRRRAMLKDFYAEQERVYEKELNQLGLAMIKARV